MDRAPRHRLWAALVVGGSLAGTWGCSSPEQPPEEPDDDVIPQVAVPPADGPQLSVIRHRLVIRDRPSVSGKVLGTLRAGTSVARAVEPYSTRGCAGGWYPIRPRGFVCAGEDATAGEPSPVAAALATGPAIGDALPYRYARITRGAAVAYGALPSREGQAEAEPKLARHLKARAKVEPSPLGTGANDVPLDDDGMPTGLPVLMPDGQAVGEDGRRTSETWFAFADPPSLAVGAALDPAAPPTRVLKRKSGIAMAQSITIGDRRFAIMPDGRFIPADRLRPAQGTAWHGVDVSKIGLPVSFALRRGIYAYEMGKGKAERTDDEFEQHEAIPLTGRFRTISGMKYYFTRDEQWVRHRDVIIIHKRHKFPDFATEDQKWLDVSLANQTLVAWHGRKPQLATLVSSGEDRLGDPETGPATAQGIFRVRAKHVTIGVDDREVGQGYSVTEVPWALELGDGFAITGCYWHSSFGEARSYHNLALSPVDARWIWHWTEPQIPDGWHGVTIDEEAVTTIAYVHR